MHDENGLGLPAEHEDKHELYDEEAEETEILLNAAESPNVPFEEQLRLFETGRFDVHEYQCLNPGTHPDILRRLAENRNYWMFLIRNPSLPEDVLELLLIDYSVEVAPAAVLEHRNATDVMQGMELARQQHEEAPDPDNPGAKLSAAETASPPYSYDPLAWASGRNSGIGEALWFKDESYAELYAMAEPDTSELRWEWLLETWSAQLRFTPDYVLARIAKKLAGRWQARIPVQSPYGDVPQVARDLEASDITAHLRRTLSLVARHPNTPASALKEIASTGDWELTTLVAIAANTSLPVLKRILNRDGTAHAVAQHKSPKVQKLLPRLLPVLDTRGIALLAKNRHLRGMDLDDLEHSNSPLVLAALASNPNYSLKAVDRLADSPNQLIRLGAASNPKAWADTLFRLSGDPEDNVVKAVAANEGATPAILTQLHIARPDTHLDLASNPSLPDVILRDLSRADDLSIKRALAKNTSTPPEILAVLTTAEDRLLQFHAVIHPNAATATLEELQEGSPWAFIRMAARRRLESERGALDIPDRWTVLQQVIRARLEEPRSSP